MTAGRIAIFALHGFCLVGVPIMMALGIGWEPGEFRQSVPEKVFQRSDVRII